MKKIKKQSKTIVTFPRNILNPVYGFLSSRLKILEKRKHEIENDDPFRDTSRITDNAAPDTEADEQFGHARTSALRNEVQRRIIQTRKALARIKIGKYGICEDCGQMIDTDRLMVYPEATLCKKDSARGEKQ